MEHQQININLNEPQFTRLCKMGFITESSKSYGTEHLHFSKLDIKSLMSGKHVQKECDNKILSFKLSEIDNETIVEIVKRSPLFYELVNTL